MGQKIISRSLYNIKVFLLSFQLIWLSTPINISYSQEYDPNTPTNTGTGSQTYDGQTITNPYSTTNTAIKTLDEQKSECLESSTKIWNESLNRCMDKQESVEIRQKFLECEKITDLTERNSCLEKLRKEQVGDMKEENPVSWLGTSGAVVSTLTLVAINLAAKETGGQCLSKKIMTGAALGHLVSEAYNYFYAEKELRDLREAFSETVNDEEKAYEAQLKALEFLKEEQETIKSVAKKKKVAYSIVAGLYGAALLAAIWELTPYGTPCVGGAPSVEEGAFNNLETVPSTKFLKDTLFPKETISLIQEEDSLINSFFLAKEAESFREGKKSSPTLQSYNQMIKDDFLKDLNQDQKSIFKEGLLFALQGGKWIESQIFPNAHALGAAAPIGEAIKMGGYQAAGMAQAAGEGIASGVSKAGTAIKSGVSKAGTAIKSGVSKAATSAKAGTKALPSKIQNSIKTIKQKIKFLADSRVIAVFAGIAGSLSSYLAIHSSMQEKQAEKNVEHMDTIIVKFKEGMEGHCAEGRDNIGNARCYCYTPEGKKNQNRNKSETCISMWKMNDRNPFIEATVYRRLSKTEIQQACVTINQRFDPNCRCKKYKDQKTGNNACYKVNPYIQGYGPLGQSAVASQLIQSSNSLNQGNLTTGQLNSSDFIRAAARFKTGAGKLLKKINKNLKKKGQSPIPVSNDYTKKFLKASVSPNVISMAKSMASIPSGGLKPIKGPAAGVLKKMSKKTGVSSTASLKPNSVTKGEVVEELNFDLGAESTVKPKIVDDFLDKKYKIDREQIVKREDVSIWKVITNRYNLSGLPRLFGDE